MIKKTQAAEGVTKITSVKQSAIHDKMERLLLVWINERDRKRDVTRDGGDQGDTPEIMDEILTTARDLELEANKDDIEELIMGHEDELTTEELQFWMKNTKKRSEMCLLLNKRKTKEDQCRYLPLKIF
ncbi:hypothetical protein TNCV_822511 [Trichonephila clavipes]|nr:hypothetical protein TNCV_822511 [Trichonephila clavipes]